MLALVGLGRLPGHRVLTVVYSRRMSPLMTRAQQLRGEVSGIAHECFDGALVVKTLGREGDETARFRAKAARAARHHDRVGRVRGLFDPVMEALPGPRRARRAAGRHRRVGSGDIDARRARAASPTCSR